MKKHLSRYGKRDYAGAMSMIIRQDILHCAYNIYINISVCLIALHTTQYCTYDIAMG